MITSPCQTDSNPVDLDLESWNQEDSDLGIWNQEDSGDRQLGMLSGSAQIAEEEHRVNFLSSAEIRDEQEEQKEY